MERQKTTGDGWFNMKAPELTEELKNDLKALQMRSAMDPKRFYKKNDREGFSKYVQVGWRFSHIILNGVTGHLTGCVCFVDLRLLSINKSKI